MTFDLEKLLTDVMARLGEIARPVASRLLDAGDVPWPEDIIGMKVRSLLPEVGSRLIREAPADLLGSPPLVDWVTSSCLMPCGLYAAEIRLPDGFLRLTSARMSGWGRSVCSLVMPCSPEWNRQWSPETGVAGCPDRPQAYLDCDSGGLLLRLVGTETEDSELEWLGVWTVPTPSEEDAFVFPAPLYPRLVGALVESINPTDPH